MYSNRPAFDTFYIKVLLEMYHYCMELTTQCCLLDDFLSNEISFVKLRKNSKLALSFQ